MIPQGIEEAGGYLKELGVAPFGAAGLRHVAAGRATASRA